MPKISLLATAALAAALVAPAGAHAAGTIVLNPVKVKSYSMTISGVDSPSGDSLSITFLRNSGKSTQMHPYNFAEGVKVTSTQISGSLGKYGKLKLKLGKTKKVKGKLPKGCKGTLGTVRTGTVTGSFDFAPDTTYFKKIKRKKFSASSFTGKAKLDCSGSGTGGDGSGGGDGPATGGPRLTLSKLGTGGAMLSFTATPQMQQVMQTEDRDASAPASVMHMISSSGAGLTNITAATATTPGLAPFLTGQGSFAGEAMGTMAIGTLSGSLVAKFDSIGDVALMGDGAMLMQ